MPSPLVYLFAASAWAQPAPSAPSHSRTANHAPADPAVFAQAKLIYEEGRQAFELADYETAIARWSAVYGALPEGWQRARTLYNIADTHVRIYELNGDIAHLRKARFLFSRFLEEVSVVDAGRESLSSDFADASKQIDSIDALIAEVTAREEQERRWLELVARSAFDRG